MAHPIMNYGRNIYGFFLNTFKHLQPFWPCCHLFQQMCDGTGFLLLQDCYSINYLDPVYMLKAIALIHSGWNLNSIASSLHIT